MPEKHSGQSLVKPMTPFHEVDSFIEVLLFVTVCMVYIGRLVGSVKINRNRYGVRGSFLKY